MRQTAAYYLFLVYLTVIFRAILPVVGDSVSHFFEEEEHLATVHAKYGNNHLHKEIAEASAEDNSNKNQNTVKSEELISAHLSEFECAYCSYPKLSNREYSSQMFFYLPDIFLSKLIPPPKFS